MMALCPVAALGHGIEAANQPIVKYPSRNYTNLSAETLHDRN